MTEESDSDTEGCSDAEELLSGAMHVAQAKRNEPITNELGTTGMAGCNST